MSNCGNGDETGRISYLRQFFLGTFDFTSNIFCSEYYAIFYVGLRNQVEMDVRDVLESDCPVALQSCLESAPE
jgi:hypothetical protein